MSNILTWKCASRTAAFTVSKFELPKVVRIPHVFNILTWTCALPQPRANFQISTIRKCFVPLRFFLRILTWKCALVTAALTVSNLKLVKVVCTILIRKCAPHHSGVNFSNVELWVFRHFDLEMCFVPQRRSIFESSSRHRAPHRLRYRAYFWILPAHKSLEKCSLSRLSQHFSHVSLLSSDSIFSLLLFSSLCVFLPLLFSSLYIVGSLTVINSWMIEKDEGFGGIRHCQTCVDNMHVCIWTVGACCPAGSRGLQGE